MGLPVFTTNFHQFVQLLEAFYPRFLQIIFGNTVHVRDHTTDQLHCGKPSFTSAMLDWFTFRPIVKELYIIKIANCTYVMRSVKTRRMSHWVLGLILKLKVSSFQNCLNFVSMTFTSKVIIKWCWVVLYCYILVFLLFQAISQNVVLRHPTGFPRSHHIYWIEMQDVRRIDIQILYLSCLFYTKTNCAEGVPFDCYFVHSKSKLRNLNDIAVVNAHKLFRNVLRTIEHTKYKLYSQGLRIIKPYAIYGFLVAKPLSVPGINGMKYYMLVHLPSSGQ